MDVVLLCEFYRPFKYHLSSWHVRFVSDKINHSIFSCMCFELSIPLLTRIERFFTCYVISEEYAMSSSIENSSDRLVRILSSSVPNLHLYYFAFNLNSERAKLNPNSYCVIRFKNIVHNPFHEARFSNSRVTDNNEFECMIMVLRELFTWHFFVFHLKEFLNLGLLDHY